MVWWCSQTETEGRKTGMLLIWYQFFGVWRHQPFLCQSSKYLTESIPVPVLPVYYLLKETLKVTGRVTVVMGHGCKFTSPSMLNFNMHSILIHHHQLNKGAVTSAKKRRKRNCSSHVLCTVPHLSYLMMSCQTGLLRYKFYFLYRH